MQYCVYHFLICPVRKDEAVTETPEYVNFTQGEIDEQSRTGNPDQHQDMAYVTLVNSGRLISKVMNISRICGNTWHLKWKG